MVRIAEKLCIILKSVEVRNCSVLILHKKYRSKVKTNYNSKALANYCLRNYDFGRVC